jgi:hypothetical protein
MLNALIKFALPHVGSWLWENGRDLLDTTPLDSIYSLNRRQSSNAGKDCGHRRQPDPNPGKFRKFNSKVPRLLN